MTDLREKVEKALPMCGGTCFHDRCRAHRDARPAVLALLREEVGEQAFAHNGEMLELQRRMKCGHPQACLVRHMQPAATDEKSCSACASVEAAKRRWLQQVREARPPCAERREEVKKPKQRRLWVWVVLVRIDECASWHIYVAHSVPPNVPELKVRYGPRNVRVRRVEVPTK